LTLAKRITQKPLGTKIVLHFLLLELEVLANEEGNVQGDVFGGHVDGGCVYQQTNQSALMKEKPQTQKKK
jgi:hypothetical protein